MTVPAAVVGAEDSAIFSSTLRGRGRRTFATLVAVALAVTILGQISSQTRGARGPSSSSYATSSGGLAALVSLLNRNAVLTAPLTTSLDVAWTEGKLRANDLLVVVDQDLSREESAAVRDFMAEGGSIIGGGRSTDAWLLAAIFSTNDLYPDDGSSLRRIPGAAGPLQSSAPNDRPHALATADGAPWVFSFQPDAVALPWAATIAQLATDRSGATAAFRAGSLIAVADPTIFANAQLAKLDNAAFALALLQPPAGGRVVFAEAGHGFRSGRGAGLAAIPSPVRLMLLGFVLAVLAWMFAVGRRVGDPDLANRPLAPSRFEHVEAVATLAQRARGVHTQRADHSEPSAANEGL